MIPAAYQKNGITLYNCDCRVAMLLCMEALSVNVACFSPPYWGLRDYGLPPLHWADGWVGCLGLEPTPQQFVVHMVEVMRGVRDVLRDDGVVWLNIGDSYNKQQGQQNLNRSKASVRGGANKLCSVKYTNVARPMPDGLKSGNLIGVPWLLAFALQQDGWILRSDTIWHKPQPMPESLNGWRYEERDGDWKLRLGSWRPTKAHEYVFMFSKSPKYYANAQAAAEPASGTSHSRGKGKHKKSAEAESGIKQNGSFSEAVAGLVETRNPRSVWSIPTQSFKSAHFATYPEALVAKMITASVSVAYCAECGAPWAQMIGRDRVPTRPALDSKVYKHEKANGGIMPGQSTAMAMAIGNRGPQRHVTTTTSHGWRKTCQCHATCVRPAVVFDPFSGSGTTLQVARSLGLHGVGCEPNPDYVDIAVERIESPRR